MKKKILFIVFSVLIFSACQNLPETALPTLKPTLTILPATQTPNPTSTFMPVSKKDLAGLIISSPILGTPQEHPYIQPSEMITPNGLGIINSEGELIKFSGSGLFKDHSPSGIQIVYQHGFEEEFGDYVDNLYVYNSMTGETVEIVDNLEKEGHKEILSWLSSEQKFIYYNDYQTVLFEAYGYFGASQLLVADVTTGQARLLIDDGYQFDVSPDSTQIAYTTGKILDSKTKTYGGQPLEKFGCFQPRIYNIASSSSQPFDISQLNEKPVCLGYPKWSLDGRKIAWMGYFADDTFRPIVFNFQDEIGTIYEALNQKPESSFGPTSWNFGEYSEPAWMDNSTFWTPSYEVNTETGETSTPREIELPYNPRRNTYVKSLDELFNVSLNEERDAIHLSDMNGNLINSIFINDIYKGQKYEILQSGFHLMGTTDIAGWSPFAPSPNVENK